MSAFGHVSIPVHRSKMDDRPSIVPTPFTLQTAAPFSKWIEVSGAVRQEKSGTATRTSET
jgi:hypothetical protein